MKIGIFLTGQHPPGSDMVAALEDQYAMTRLARDRDWDAVSQGPAAFLRCGLAVGDGEGAGLVRRERAGGVEVGLGVGVGAGPLRLSDGEFAPGPGLGGQLAHGTHPAKVQMPGSGGSGHVGGVDCGSEAATVRARGIGSTARRVLLDRGEPPHRRNRLRVRSSASPSPIRRAKPSNDWLAGGSSRRRLLGFGGSPGTQAKASEPPTIPRSIPRTNPPRFDVIKEAREASTARTEEKIRCAGLNHSSSAHRTSTTGTR